MREVEPYPTPPTFDDIDRHIKNGTCYAEPRVWETLRLLVKSREVVEHFNFGPLKLDTISDAQRECIDFIRHGLFRLPYPICVYRATIEFENRPVGYTLLMVEAKDKEAKIKKPRVYNNYLEDPLGRDTATISMIHTPNFMMAIHSVNTFRTKNIKGTGESVVEVSILKRELDYWASRGFDLKANIIGYDDDGDPLVDGSDILSEGSLFTMGLTMILNTKGVLKERHAPAEKPNLKRLKANRPLLPYVTRVYTGMYNQAVAPGTGTHASPRPHRRRAHVRHYIRDGRDWYTPVDAMLVNWDGEPLKARETYKVHPHG